MVRAFLLLSVLAPAVALAVPGGEDDPLLNPAWDRPSARLPWVVGGAVTGGGGVSIEPAGTPLDPEPFAPVFDGDAWFDVVQVGFTIGPGVQLARVLNRLATSRDVAYSAIGIEGGRHWGYWRLGVHYRSVLTRKGKVVSGSSTRLLLGGFLALESRYDLGYRFVVDRVAVTPNAFVLLSFGERATAPGRLELQVAGGVAVTIAFNGDLDEK